MVGVTAPHSAKRPSFPDFVPFEAFAVVAVVADVVVGNDSAAAARSAKNLSNSLLVTDSSVVDG